MKKTQRFTRIAALGAGLATLAFLIVGAVFHWTWAGFDKPLYDWMQLLVIPVVLALVAVWFNRIDKKNELTIASDNQQEAALQGYLDKVSELLLDRHLRTLKPENEAYHEVRNVARVRTLTMLYQLNTRRTNYMLAFLRESELVTADTQTTIITFSQADLHNADLHEINLSKIDCSGADLSGTNLRRANLSGATLVGANLREADLNGAILRDATLSGADLSAATLNGANFSGADLRDAILYRAILRKAILSKGDLSRAILREATFNGTMIDKSSLDKSTATKEQIATMRTISL